MSLFRSKGRKSAAVVFGKLNHMNNNKAEDLQQGTTKRYQQFSDAQYAAQVLVDRLNVAPRHQKYHLNKK